MLASAPPVFSFTHRQSRPSRFIHGGTNSADGTLSDTFVLSLPAFTWFKVDVNAPARMDHACAVVGKRQMLISGGLAVQWDWKTNDEWVGARKVLDMTALEFRDCGYDAGAGVYEPAQVIKDWYYKGLVVAVHAPGSCDARSCR